MIRNNKDAYLSRHTTKQYSDLDLSFIAHPINRDIAIKTNVDAIRQSIKNLVFMNHYEKPFHPDIGCDVYRTLFENIELPGTKDQIIEFIRYAIDNYETRANVVDVLVDADPDNNGVNVMVIFTPENSSEIVKLALFLKILR